MASNLYEREILPTKQQDLFCVITLDLFEIGFAEPAESVFQ